MTVSLSSYQFDSVDSDVILLSNGAECPTEFHVHRCILSAASSFFHDMFTLPQAPLTVVDKPVIPVTETRQTLDTLLRFIYPLPEPNFNSLEELEVVMDAAVKYDCTSVIDKLRRLLVSPEYIQTSPLRVYAIACRCDFDEEAKLASKYSLNFNVLDAPSPEDLKQMSGYSYYRLLNLHRQRARSAVALLKIPEEIKCMQCNGSAFTSQGAPKWWYEFEKRAKEELDVRPTTDVVFGLEFLAKAACATRCLHCSGSVIDSWKFLQTLKVAIDALPSTI